MSQEPKSKSSSVNVDLPRGLWVGKLRRLGVKRDEVVPEGRRPWEVWPEDFYPLYYYRIVRAGEKVVQKCLETENYREAVKRALVRYELHQRARWDAEARELQELKLGKRKERVVSTAGEVFQAFLKVYPRNLRAVQSARRVYALGVGLIPAGASPQESAIREGSDLARRIDSVPADRVFCAEVVRGYYTAAQGGTFDPVRRDRRHLAINKTRRFAGELFSKGALSLCYGGVVLPELAGWVGHPYLKEEAIDPREKAISPEAFAAMVEGARGLLASGDAGERAMGLCNWVLRVLGLRSKEALFLRRGWVWRDPRSGRWYVDVKSRPEEGFVIKGAEEGQVPLSEELRAALLWQEDGGPGDFVLLPGAAEGERRRLVEEVHNAWLKGIIGHIHNRQGNHRLRANVGSFVAAKYGDRLAGLYLRHADRRTTAGKHYIAPRGEELPVVTDAELLGRWGRVENG